MRKIKNFAVGVTLLLLAIVVDHHILKEEKMDFNKETGGWKFLVVAFFCYFLLFLLISTQACKTMQVVSFSEELRDSMPQDVAGLTICDTLTGDVYVKISSHLGRFYPMVERHEKTHVEQIVRYGGCRAIYHAKMADPELSLRLEYEAYCRGIEYGANNLQPFSPDGWKLVAAQFLAKTHNVDVKTALRGMLEECSKPKYHWPP